MSNNLKKIKLNRNFLGGTSAVTTAATILFIIWGINGIRTKNIRADNNDDYIKKMALTVLILTSGAGVSIVAGKAAKNQHDIYHVIRKCLLENIDEQIKKPLQFDENSESDLIKYMKDPKTNPNHFIIKKCIRDGIVIDEMADKNPGLISEIKRHRHKIANGKIQFETKEKRQYYLCAIDKAIDLHNRRTL